MDEPTSSLDRHDSARLLELVGELRSAGAGVLYVSHRLEEIVRVADRAVVLRDGAVAGELPRDAIDERALVELMAGDGAADATLVSPDDRRDGTAAFASPRPPVLEARELRLASRSKAVSFTLGAGEILGVFGLVGAGRTELVESLFGLRRLAGGTVSIGGGGVDRDRQFAPRGPRDAIAAGLALVPEDRKAQGLIAEMSVSDNLALASLARRPLLARRDRAAERRAAAALCTALDIRPPSPELEVGRLSGGNQQKVALGKWLALDTGMVLTTPSASYAPGAEDGALPRILLLDEPTRGVDVAARAEIHRRLRELAGRGVAILLSSAETEEILLLADRVLVLRGGAVAGVLEGAERTEAALLRLAAGAAASP
jgi:ribose transport system ATP-binding protein